MWSKLGGSGTQLRRFNKLSNIIKQISNVREVSNERGSYITTHMRQLHADLNSLRLTLDLIMQNSADGGPAVVQLPMAAYLSFIEGSVRKMRFVQQNR